MSVLFGILILLFLTGPLFWILRPHRSHAYAWLAALPPALVTIWQIAQLPAVTQGKVVYAVHAWAPSLGLEIALTLDGLALFFGLIVTGIGTGIAFYTNYYFERDARQGYFYFLLYFFMASMLGLVWSDDLLTLFVFWEFTSISSYLLIAFKTDDKYATEGARRALIVTTAGGLAMLAGFILLGQFAGTFRISAILAHPGWSEAPIYPAVLVLIFLGAFTKSAQFPFQFWLPGAMAAPTPASAYLHSATMVKAGIFLLARLHPGFSDSPLWFWTLFLVGGFTMVLGAVSSIRYTDMKALLAYATISQLGLFAMMLGFPGEEAALTVFVAILGHALYKAPLFLSAGIVDHAMGTRDLRYLSNLWRTLPSVMLVAVVAGLSMAGIPPTLGFLAKELLLEHFYHLFTHAESMIGAIGMAASIVMGIFMVAAILTLVWEAYFRPRATVAHPAHLHHKPSFWFAMPALVLALLGTLAPLTMALVEQLIYPPVATLLNEEFEMSLKLWHGWTPVFIASLIAIGLGVAAFALRRPIRRGFNLAPLWLNCQRGYDAIIDGTYRLAYRITVIVQGGPMAPQIAVILLSGALAIAFAVIQTDLAHGIILDSYDLPTLGEILIIVVAIVAAVTTVRARSRLSAIISLGIVGVAVTLFFVFFSAPDLALTQLLIEVLTVILLVLVFFRIKPDTIQSRIGRRRLFQILVSLAVGLFGFAIVMVNHVAQIGESISPYFLENALPLGQGGNVVNVILVDFRGYDTLGEITVLGIAALGGYALLRSPQLHAVRQRINAARQALKQAREAQAGGGDD